MSVTDSSDLVSIISIHRRLTSEEFQNLTHSEQIIHLKQRKLEDRNQDLQSDKNYKNQFITTLRGKIRSTSKSLKNQIEESLRSNNVQILTTQLNSVLNSEIIRLKSKIDITDRHNLHIFDRHPGINYQIDYPHQNPEQHRPACSRPASPPTSPLSH